MAMEKGPFLFAKLFLAPLNLDATIYCWLVNMAAFEMWTETAWEDCSVNSYLSVLSLLMHREEDVRELRVKRIVHGTSSDQQALEFFKDLAPGVSEGNAYWRLIGGVQAEEVAVDRHLQVRLQELENHRCGAVHCRRAGGHLQGSTLSQAATSSLLNGSCTIVRVLYHFNLCFLIKWHC